MRIPVLILAGVLGLGLSGCDRHAVRGIGHAVRGERHLGQGHGLKRECRADIEQYCAAVGKGRERRQCLESHLDKLSQGCKTALEERGRNRRGGRANRDTGTDDSE